MGTLATVGGRAQVKIRDTGATQFTTTELMGIVNSILNDIYDNLVAIRSNLVYSHGTIVTLPGKIEYTPSFSHNGFLDEGVWIDGEDGFLKQLTEQHKMDYDVDDTVTHQIVNGDFTDWTGGSPDNWTESNVTTTEETSSSYKGSSCKLTASAAGGSIRSAGITVTPAETYYLYFRYKNTSGDYAQYGIYDVTNSAWITEMTDLGSSTTWSDEQEVEFDTPTDCKQIYIYFAGKNNTDVVWIDHASLKGTSSCSEPEAYYLTEDQDVGFLWVPDDVYTIHVHYWEPLTEMSTYASDTLPFDGVFNQYIERMLVVECLEILEQDNSRQAILAQMSYDKAMNRVYGLGLKPYKSISNMFSVEGI